MFLNLLQHWLRTGAQQGDGQTEPSPTNPQPMNTNERKKETLPEDPPPDKDE
jgi:hypothetical protein